MTQQTAVSKTACDFSGEDCHERSTLRRKARRKTVLEENVCRFIPFEKDYQALHTIHFVRETKTQFPSAMKSESVYKMYYVYRGEGKLHLLVTEQELTEGDIFFTFPGQEFCIESGINFAYYYISFVGLRGNRLLEKLHISHSHALFHDCNPVYDIWRNGLDMRPEFSNLTSEAVLLYTFSYLGGRVLPVREEDANEGIASEIKKYIDDHFQDNDLSLEKIGRDLSYNRKYISTVFKKSTGTGLIEYLNTIRIQYACTLIRQGFTSVTDIATMCGYSDAQYFSRVFKKSMGCAPSECRNTGK